MCRTHPPTSICNELFTVGKKAETFETVPYIAAYYNIAFVDLIFIYIFTKEIIMYLIEL